MFVSVRGTSFGEQTGHSGNNGGREVACPGHAEHVERCTVETCTNSVKKPKCRSMLALFRREAALYGHLGLASLNYFQRKSVLLSVA